jgi:hypothetical protein
MMGPLGWQFHLHYNEEEEEEIWSVGRMERTLGGILRNAAEDLHQILRLARTVLG